MPHQQCLFLAGLSGPCHAPCFRDGFLEPCPVPSWLLLEPFSFLSLLLPLSSLAWPQGPAFPQQSAAGWEGGKAACSVPHVSDGPIPQQNRQMKHISAEQKRRFNIKMGFDTLNSLISNNSKLVSCLGALGEEPWSWGMEAALTPPPACRPATPSPCRRRWSTSPSCSRSAARCRRKLGGCGTRSRSSTPPSCEAGPGGLGCPRPLTCTTQAGPSVSSVQIDTSLLQYYSCCPPPSQTPFGPVVT